MNQHLLNYLRSLGLKEGATKREAWDFYAQLQGEKRENAKALKRGEATLKEDGTVERAGSATDPANPAPTPQPSPAPANVPQDPNEAIRQERERVRQIREIAGDDLEPQTLQRAIDEGWTVEDVRERTLRSLRNRPEPVSAGGPPAVHVARDAATATLAAGLAIRTGGDPIKVAEYFVERAGSQDERKAQAERIANEADRYNDMSLVDLTRSALQANGHTVPVGRNEAIRAGFATGSLTNVMAPALNARMMTGYMETEDRVGPIVTEVDVPDFRKNERHQMGQVATPNKRPRGSAAKSGTISDRAPEEYQVFEYAESQLIDRQDIIDDRLDVFQVWPVRLGGAFRRLRPQLIFYILLSNPNMADGTALFAAGHNNDQALALNKDNFETAVALMRTQQQDGVNVEVQPATLITAAELESTAWELLSSPVLITGDSATRGASNWLNRLGMNPPIGTGYLSNGVTDPDTGNSVAGSSTAWFLFADPNQAPVFEVGYVAGLGRRPELNTRTVNGEGGKYGMEINASHAVAAAPLDWRSMVRGNG